MSYLRYGILGIFVVAAGVLLAVGPRGGVKHKPGYVVVQYWEKWTGNEADQMRMIVDDFNRTVGEQKHIEVEYLSQSSVDLKTLIATSAGVPPDIAGIWDAQLASYAAVDALEPLDELAKEHGIKAEDYKKIFWDPCHYRGKLYALVSTPASTALHWNKRIFMENAAELRAAGCDPTRAPRTLKELNAYAAALVKRDRKGNIIDLGFVPEEPGWYIIQTPVWFGGTLYDERTGKLTLNGPRNIEAMDWIRGFSERLGSEALNDFHSGEGSFDTAENPFLLGSTAMILQGPWMSNYITEYKPAMNAWKHPLSWNAGKTPAERADNCEWGVAPFPSVYSDDFTKPDDFIDKGVTWCAADQLAIPRGAKHPREAFEFMAYVNRMDVMEKLCSLHCKNTPLSHHSDTWYQNHPNPYVEVFDRLASSPNAQTLPPIPIWSQVTEELGAVTQRVAQLKQGSKAALDLSQARMQRLLDQFRERHPQDPRSARPGDHGKNSLISSDNRQFFKGIAFISPWIIGFLLFMLLPIALSFYFSLTDWSLSQKSEPFYIGLANYRELMGDAVFWQVLRNTFLYAAMALPAELAVSLGLALLLNTQIPGQPLFRTIIFLPSLVPIVASAMIWLWLFNARLGLINTVLGWAGIPGPPWLINSNWALPALAFMSLWGVGYTVVIFLAGLQDVPRELYEAAEIDGASPARRLWHVTIPMISPVIFFNLIMAIIGTFQVFQVPYIMTGGGPDRSTYFYTMYLFDSAFKFTGRMGYASAMAWIQLLIILVLTAAAFWSSRKWVYYQGK